MPQTDAQAVSTPYIQEKRRRRRAEILHAALQAFREKGYHVITLEDIAGRLGVRKTALYHYFPDKEAILNECHRESLWEVYRLLTEADVRFRSARERLAYIIHKHVQLMTETHEGSPLAFALSPERPHEVITARDHYERGLHRIITQGIRTGEFRPVNPKIAVFAILGAINWIARWYRPNGSIRGAELGVEFADLLVGGLICSG